MQQSFSRYAWIAVLSLIALGLALRLYDLTDQPIDFHSTRQLRGAIIARGMYYEMLPTADEATRQQAKAFWQSTGQYEPSILERLVAITYLALGQEVWWVARIYSSLFWIIGGIALFALVRRMSLAASTGKTREEAEIVSTGSALFALAYYLVLPFSVQASRSFQPDPGMVMWIILAVYALYRWSESQEWKWAILSGLLAGVAVLTKAVAFYILAGALLAMILSVHFFGSTFFRRQAWKKALTDPQAWSIAALMVIPTALYYLGREGRASEYFSSWTVALSHLLLEPITYLRWGKMVQSLMNPIALLLSLAGIVIASSRNRLLLLGLWGGYIVYGLFLPYQMYTHNYYHLQLVPIIALSMAPAVRFVLEHLLTRDKVWQAVVLGATLALFLFSSWVAIQPLYRQDYRNEPAYWQEIASYLPNNGKIIGLTQDYGYRLMYYGWRKVTLWPNRGEQKLTQLRGSNKEFEEYFAKRTQGKNYFLITAFRQFDDQPDLKEMLYQNFPVLAEGQGYLIFNLSQPNQSQALP